MVGQSSGGGGGRSIPVLCNSKSIICVAVNVT